MHTNEQEETKIKLIKWMKHYNFLVICFIKHRQKVKFWLFFSLPLSVVRSSIDEILRKNLNVWSFVEIFHKLNFSSASPSLSSSRTQRPFQPLLVLIPGVLKFPLLGVLLRNLIYVDNRSAYKFQTFKLHHSNYRYYQIYENCTELASFFFCWIDNFWRI